MTVARRPVSQEQILEAAVASLTEAGIPLDGQDGWLDQGDGSARRAGCALRRGG